MAGTGVLRRACTLLQMDANGMPPSRARAKKDRETEVIEPSPQNHIANIVRTSTPRAARAPRADWTIVRTAGSLLPLESSYCKILLKSGIARDKERTNRYPKMLETTTEITIPQGACRRGSKVSSAMWADASKPV